MLMSKNKMIGQAVMPSITNKKLKKYAEDKDDKSTKGLIKRYTEGKLIDGDAEQVESIKKEIVDAELSKDMDKYFEEKKDKFNYKNSIKDMTSEERQAFITDYAAAKVGRKEYKDSRNKGLINYLKMGVGAGLTVGGVIMVAGFFGAAAAFPPAGLAMLAVGAVAIGLGAAYTFLKSRAEKKKYKKKVKESLENEAKLASGGNVVIKKLVTDVENIFNVAPNKRQKYPEEISPEQVDIENARPTSTVRRDVLHTARGREPAIDNADSAVASTTQKPSEKHEKKRTKKPDIN